jgi:hypothetical protein
MKQSRNVTHGTVCLKIPTNGSEFILHDTAWTVQGTNQGGLEGGGGEILSTRAGRPFDPPNSNFLYNVYGVICGR